MGIFSKIGGFVARQGGHVAGTVWIKFGSASVSRQWERLTKKNYCPACDRGRLYPFSIPVDGVQTQFLGCNVCDYFQELAIGEAQLSVLRERTLKRVSNMPQEDRLLIERSYMVASRFYYGASVAAFFAEIYALLSGSSSWMIFGLSILMIFFFLHGSLNAYRFWQVSEKLYFVPGAFKSWLKSGPWVI